MNSLTRIVTVDGQELKADYVEYTLELSAVGTARVAVLSKETMTGLVVIKSGYRGSTLKVDFIGLIEDQVQKDTERRLLLCRELSTALNVPLNMALRHCTANDVLTELSNQTGLAFQLPEKPYSTTKQPFYYITTTGLHALNQLGSVFNIPEYIWHQGEKGEVYAGAYEDSGRANKAVNVKESLFTTLKTTAAVLPAIPGLKPGHVLNERYVKSIRVINTILELEWSSNLSGY